MRPRPHADGRLSRTMAIDEAKRARLQARLDKETSKSSLAEKVRRRVRPSRTRSRDRRLPGLSID